MHENRGRASQEPDNSRRAPASRRNREKKLTEEARAQRILADSTFTLYSALKGVDNPIKLSGTKRVGTELLVPNYLQRGMNVLFQPPFSDLLEDNQLLDASVFAPPKKLSFPLTATNGFETDTLSVSKADWILVQTAQLYAALFIQPGWPTSRQHARPASFAHSLSAREIAHQNFMHEVAEQRKEATVIHLLQHQRFVFENMFKTPTAAQVRERIDRLMGRVNTKLSALYEHWQTYFVHFGSHLDQLGTVTDFAVPSFIHYKSKAPDFRLAGMDAEAPELFTPGQLGQLTQAEFASTVGIAGKEPTNQRRRIFKSGLLT